MLFVSFDFWDESFWLPANLTWTDMEKVRGKYQNSVFYQDFINPWIAAVFLILLRNFLERKIFLPIGIYFKVKDEIEKTEHNAILEEAFKKSSYIDNKKILSLAKQTDWSEKRVNHWWSIRSAECKHSELHRFCERSWEALFYVYNFIYGVLMLWNKEWIWDLTKFFNIPYQIESDLWWYHTITTGFFWSLLFSVIKDYKNKDFLELFVHHIIAILVINISRISGVLRFAATTAVVHDCADIFLEVAKIARYIGYKKTSNALLVFFMVLWVITRLYIYPVYIVLRLCLWAPITYPAFTILKFLCVMLIFLHIYWTNQVYHILRKVFFVNMHVSRQESKLEHQTTNSGIKDQLISNGNHRKAE